MRDFQYKLFSILGLIFLFVIKWTLQLDVFGYDYLGHSMGMFTIILQDFVFATIFPSIVLIVAILLTSKKIASMVIAISNIVITLIVLVHNTLMYAALFAGSDVFWSRWIYLVNIIPLIMTIIHIVKINKKPSEGLVSYNI